jgi:hypothetical protein
MALGGSDGKHSNLAISNGKKWAILSIRHVVLGPHFSIFRLQIQPIHAAPGSRPSPTTTRVPRVVPN